MKSKLLFLLGLLVSVEVVADTYSYNMNGSSIVNLDTQKGVLIDFTDLTTEGRYQILGDGVQNLAYVSGNNVKAQLYEVRDNYAYFREPDLDTIRVTDTVTSTPAYRYARTYVYDMTTQKIVKEQLIAADEASYLQAKRLGFDVVQSPVDAGGTGQIMVTYASNILNDGQITTNGGLYTNQVSSTAGISIVRQEVDGTIHLGQNSLVFGEGGRGAFANDTLYSSNGVLEIGNNKSHRTIVNGTLEIQDPTAPNHAATKNYVDSNFHTKNYVDSSVAQAMAMSALPRSLNGKTVVGFAAGTHGGQQALAFGVSKYLPESGVHFNTSVSHTSTTSTSGSVGVGFEF